MDPVLYIKLSVMMFLQFAVWGAWMPVLAGRLLGPLKMTGKQTGWIYGTLFLASIITPLIAGQIVDRWLPTQWFLAGAHLGGGLLMLASARQTRFGPMFLIMSVYSLLFAPTIPLANALMFRNLSDPQMQSFGIMLWGPIGWTVAGLALSGWRRWSKSEGDGRDCQQLAALLSFIMAGACLLLPHTPPAGSAEDLWPFLDALKLLQNTEFLVFIIVSFVMTALLQFYFLGTAPFLETIGISRRNVPAVMAIAQIAQVAVMPVVPLVLPWMGFSWAMTLGVSMWLVMYLPYAAMKPKAMVVSAMALHGTAYAFFVNVGWVYISRVAPESIQSSAQALLTVATFGLGMFMGTQFAGFVMDRLRRDEQFHWRTIYLVPAALSLACSIVLVLGFSGRVS